MEEVWRDINLASLHDHSSREGFSVNPNPHNPHFFLQEFLARPFSREPPTSRVSRNGETTIHASPVRPPTTVLSLNSGPGLDFLDNSDPLSSNWRLQSSPISNLPAFSSPFETLVPSSTLASFGNKKRVLESDKSSGDRRYKRMIKNRESAARSRARKQEAYTNELELEVAHLAEENARLKRQQEQLRVVAAGQLSKKRTLQRTSTAPF